MSCVAAKICMGFSAPAILALFLLFLKKKKDTFLKVLVLVCAAIMLFPIGGRILNGMSYNTNRWIWAFEILVFYIMAAKWNELIDLPKKQWLILVISTAVLYGLCMICRYSRSKESFTALAVLFIALYILRESSSGMTVRGRQVMLVGLSLLQAARLYWESLPEKYEGKRFYHISTDEVYGALEMTRPEGIEPPFSTKASSGKHHLAYGERFFTEDMKYQPHSPYSAAKASSDHFVRAFHDTYGLPVIVTNCSNNYGPYQFPEKLIPLFINNIRHRKPLPVYGKGENVRDWLYVEDHARAIDLIFHEGRVAETYNIGGFNEWKNIDLIRVLIATVDRLLGRPEGADEDLITFVTDRAGHDLRYAIDSSKLQKELGWEPSLQFEEGIEKTVRWYLEHQDWLDNVTSGDYQKYYETMYAGR